MLAKLRLLKDHGETILMSEQNCVSRSSIADRAYIIDGGELKYEGLPRNWQMTRRCAKPILWSDGIAPAKVLETRRMDEANSKIRRIVTGHYAAGKAVVWIDGPATNHKRQASVPSTHTSTLLWVTDRLPADMLGEEDTGQRILGTAPPDGGSRFAVIEFQPLGIKTNMHRTDTIDYVVCLSGEIDMDLDDFHRAPETRAMSWCSG